ncbi:TetR/AcrR family transcriptional regulator [Pseudactinotalea sp.]|uniref:TetR/AcrR family transcriptional regulator n=1 Tax=Pseudactinotalea sp. TaxID=1926260 RepID=UPI003B3A58A3
MSARDDLLAKVVAWFMQNGVGDTSLRTVAAGVGSSHRMLLYHFRSREDLLAAVVDVTWAAQARYLDEMLDGGRDPVEAGQLLWKRLADEASTFGPLFFELAAAAMHGHEWASSLRTWIGVWNERLTDYYMRAGHDRERAASIAQTSLALARGVLFELALGGDRARADAIIVDFLTSYAGPRR